MSVFSSKRERFLWLCVLVCILAIYATLGLAATFVGIVGNEKLGIATFLLGMFLVGLTIFLQGWGLGMKKIEIAVAVGISAVYLLFFLRLTIPERSHLIAYGVVAVFIYEALTERKRQGRQVPFTPLLAILLTAFIGVLDEGIQVFIPNRVFDYEDILFNLLAAVMSVLASWILSMTRNYSRKNKF